MRLPSDSALLESCAGPALGPADPRLLRARAEARLRSVMHGASPLPLDRDEARAMAQVTFAAVTSGLVAAPATPSRVAPVFNALLSHPDLAESDLAWIAEDRAVAHPSVFNALLSHPSATLDVALRALRHTLWPGRGALDEDDWIHNHPLVSVLRGADPRNGPGLALLLALWVGDDFAQFCASAHLLCAAPQGAVEILGTLAADLRLAGGHRQFRIPQGELVELVEKAVLLARLDPIAHAQGSPAPPV